VIDPVFQQNIESTISVRLGGTSKCKASEDRPGTSVPRVAKFLFLDQRIPLFVASTVSTIGPSIRIKPSMALRKRRESLYDPIIMGNMLVVHDDLLLSSAHSRNMMLQAELFGRLGSRSEELSDSQTEDRPSKVRHKRFTGNAATSIAGARPDGCHDSHELKKAIAMSNCERLAVTAKFFGGLRKFMNDSAATFTLNCNATLGDLLREIARRSPELHEKLEKGLRGGYLNAMIDGRNARLLGNLETPLSNGNTVAFTPPIGGG